MNATTATDDHSLSSSPVSRPQGGGTDAALHLLCAYLSIALLLGLGANARPLVVGRPADGARHRHRRGRQSVSALKRP
jgi:hypothetical protein